MASSKASTFRRINAPQLGGCADSSLRAICVCLLHFKCLSFLKGRLQGWVGNFVAIHGTSKETHNVACFVFNTEAIICIGGTNTVSALNLYETPALQNLAVLRLEEISLRGISKARLIYRYLLFVHMNGLKVKLS